jgi:hypothetical protein
MTAREVSKHSGYLACAQLYLAKALKTTGAGLDDHGKVAFCVEKGFGGDVGAFVAWARGYLEDGCGTRG